MENVEQIGAKALELVLSSPSRSLIGARLGALLKSSFPAFTPTAYGARNLRDFLRLHATGLTEKSHAGVDVLFVPVEDALSPTPLAAQSAPASTVSEAKTSESRFIRLPLDASTWRVYSNPSSPLLVVFNGTTKEAMTIDPNAHVAEPWVVLEKPSSDTHLEMARSFAASQPSEVKQSLEKALTSPVWYQQFSTLAKRLNVGGAWANARITKLSSMLETTLLGLGTPLNALRSVRPSQAPNLVPAASELQGARDKFSELDIRQLVETLVADMPIEELRSMRFPLGSILDLVKGK